MGWERGRERVRSTMKVLQHASATTLNHNFMGLQEESGAKDKGVMTSNVLPKRITRIRTDDDSN